MKREGTYREALSDFLFGLWVSALIFYAPHTSQWPVSQGEDIPGTWTCCATFMGSGCIGALAERLVSCMIKHILTFYNARKKMLLWAPKTERCAVAIV